MSAAPLTAESREHRKTVTVLFCDVTGSTALGESTDPEALRALLARYFERMKAIVESHGGAVEKFIGDAVMAVFGVRSRMRTTRSGRAGRRSRCARRCRNSGSAAGSASTPARW
jgi:class 3 adenylate cyclase